MLLTFTYAYVTMHGMLETIKQLCILEHHKNSEGFVQDAFYLQWSNTWRDICSFNFEINESYCCMFANQVFHLLLCLNTFVQLAEPKFCNIEWDALILSYLKFMNKRKLSINWLSIRVFQYGLFVLYIPAQPPFDHLLC